MTRDIATITRRAHDTGFEQGANASLQAVAAFLERRGHMTACADLSAAIDNDTLVEPAEPAPPVAPPPGPAAATEPAPIGVPSAAQARGMGYTGDACAQCQGLRVKRNGACLVCEDCGSTTGCS